MTAAKDSRTELERFGRFAAVGVVAAVADMAALEVAVRAIGLDLYSARVLSYLVASTTAWWLNRRLSFADRNSASRLREWGRYLGANLLGGAINYGVYAALVSTLPVAAHYPFLAVAAGSLAGLATNFTMSRQFVFVRA